jgi:hypothetical protein
MKQGYLTIGVLLLLSILLAAYVRIDMQASPPRPASSTQIMEAAVMKVGMQQTTGPRNTGVIELEWDALIPIDWQVDKLIEEYNAEDLSDDDPRARELLEKIKASWKEAPVVHDYDGKTVKLPGFVVPLEMDAKTIREFLLVPYYGACIHTPPPPANQTVYVVTDEDHAYQGELFDTVWVTGTITVEKLSSGLGDAGYRIDATKVEPYQ